MAIFASVRGGRYQNNRRCLVVGTKIVNSNDDFHGQVLRVNKNGTYIVEWCKNNGGTPYEHVFTLEAIDRLYDKTVYFKIPKSTIIIG